MKIIIRNSDNVVLYAGDDITLTEEGATSQNGSFDASTTTATATLVADASNAPEQWIGGGYMYTDGVWAVFDQAVIDAAFPPAPTPQRRITKLAMLNRFTDDEAIAFDLASIGATVQAAALRRYMSKINAATYVDLNRPDTRAGVQALEAGGLLAEGRALEILDAPIEAHEVYQGV